MTDLEKVQNALEAIIANIDRYRPRGWHVYPTRLRDQAVRALEETGYSVKSYAEYEAETEKQYGGDS